MISSSSKYLRYRLAVSTRSTFSNLFRCSTGGSCRLTTDAYWCSREAVVSEHTCSWVESLRVDDEVFERTLSFRGWSCEGSGRDENSPTPRFPEARRPQLRRRVFVVHEHGRDSPWEGVLLCNKRCRL